MERASSVFARLCLLVLLPSTLVAGRLLSLEAVVAGIVVDMVGCDMVGCVVVGAGKSPISLLSSSPDDSLEIGTIYKDKSVNRHKNYIMSQFEQLLCFLFPFKTNGL